MDRFNILIVDDDDEQVENHQAMCSEYPEARVFTATQPEQAHQLIRDNFFHLALVDLDFKGEAIGTQILAFLNDYRPTCECVLVTRRPTEHQTDLLKLLDPVRRLAHAIVDKRNWLPILREYLDGKIRDWTRSPVRIESLDAIVEALASKSLASRVAVTRDEADYLLSSLHGQGTFSDRSDFEVSSITTARMTGGRSNSVVLKCQPRTSHQMSGIWTVVKLSPRLEAAEEYLRYLRYVRFLVSLDARVELLGYVPGDTLGAICYSFAGRTPNVVQGLNDLFETLSSII